VLIVDNDRESCNVLKTFFEEFGCKVAMAEDGVEAIDYLSLHAFDLVVSEVIMPQLCGIEFMKEVKRREMNVPIIFITSWGKVESYMELMNMGAFDYLNKPVNKLEILKIAKSAIQNQGEHAEAAKLRDF
jgi:DNA-binding NtrC family response regulator